MTRTATDVSAWPVATTLQHPSLQRQQAGDKPARAISDAQQTAPNIEEKSGREEIVSARELRRLHGNPDTHNRAIHSPRARAATEAAAKCRALA